MAAVNTRGECRQSVSVRLRPPCNERQRNAIEVAKRMIWWFYQAKSEPCVPAFERIFKRRRTGYATLDGLLMRLFHR